MYSLGVNKHSHDLAQVKKLSVSHLNLSRGPVHTNTHC